MLFAIRMKTPAKTEPALDFPEREMIAGLAKGLAVIRAFGAIGPFCTLTDLARAAALTPPAVRRCLHTLQSLGYVGREGRRFFLRPRILELGTPYLDGVRNEELAADYLQSVAQATGQSSSLAVMDGYDVVYLARVGVRRMIRVEASVGARYPAFATSLGRVLLSRTSETELREFLACADRTALTRKTVTSTAKLVSLIRRADRDGYCLVEDELAIGIMALAVPIHAKNGRVVAAINCSVYTGDVSQAQLLKFLPNLQDTAARIARALPHFPGLTVPDV
jgi:IclR family pca regulon transcriptional regulator